MSGIYGLSGSGLDIDSIVKSSMKAKQTTYDKLYKSKTQLEWKKSQYHDMYTLVRDFRNTVFSSKLQANLSPKKVASTSTAVSATASSDAANMTHTIEVSKLAAGVQQTSSSAITTGVSKDTLANQFKMTDDASIFTLKIANGNSSATINVDTSQSIYDLVNNINKAGINITANYDATLDRVFLATSGTGAASGIDFTGSSAAGIDFITNKLKLITPVAVSDTGTASSTAVDGTLKSLFNFTGGNMTLTNGSKNATIAIDENDTLTTLADKISNATGVNASATFGSDGKFTIKATTGTLSIAGSGSNAAAVNSLLTNNLNLTSLAAVGTTGVTSSAQIGASLQNLFGFSGGNLIIDDGSQTTVNLTSSDTLSTLLTKINGTGKATAGFDELGKFYIKAGSGSTIDLTSSDAAVSTLLTTGLKLGSLNGIDDTTGVTGSVGVGVVDPSKNLADLFTGLSGKVNLKIDDGVNAAKTVEIDLATDTVSSIAKKINELGLNATANYNATTRKFTLAATSGTLNLSGSDALAVQFLENNLQLTNAGSGAFSSISSSTEVFADPAANTLASQFGMLSGTLNFKMTNGNNIANISVNTATDTLATLASKIQSATGMSASASFDPATNKFTIATTNGTLDFTGSDQAALSFLTTKLKINNYNQITTAGAVSTQAMFTGDADKPVLSKFDGLSGGAFTLRFDDGSGAAPMEVAIDTASDSISDMVDKVNTALGGKGFMAYNAVTGKVALVADSGVNLDLSGSDAAALQFLNNNLKLNSSISQKGSDAEIKLDGIAINEASNTFTVAGVSYTLNGVTNTGGVSNPASVVVTADVDKTVENVKKFVETYNTLLEKLNDKVNEEKYPDYLPLTDEEKSQMSDDQVKLWTDKAKSGLLHNDTRLSKLITSMRNSFTDAVVGITGSYTTASSLGIDTGLGTYSEGGKLYVDEAKLKSALNNDPNAAYKIFGTDGTMLTTSQKGIMGRLYDNLKSGMDQIVAEAGMTADTTYDTTSYEAKQIKDYTKRMTNLSDIMADQQEALYKRWDAFETAYSQLQSQSSWITQQLGSR